MGQNGKKILDEPLSLTKAGGILTTTKTFFKTQ